VTRNRGAQCLLVLLTSLCTGGCTTPVSRGSRFAQRHHFTRAVEQGTVFRHVVWRKEGSPRSVLHVYLDGDGSPHPSPTTIARDPTPRQPLMLQLMALDPAPSVYVGRPCYWGLYADPDCSAATWTLGRFSTNVIDSIVAVIRREQAAAMPRTTVLFGHSGGGTLAILAAQRGLEVTKIITVAANLDPDAWSAVHGYSPLILSINPAHLGWSHAPPSMTHYVGARDANVTPQLVHEAAGRIGGEVIEIAAFDHQCCWARIWSRIAQNDPPSRP
jgi:pimeloyl-ACP methyl ester carboxylesterase